MSYWFYLYKGNDELLRIFDRKLLDITLLRVI